MDYQFSAYHYDPPDKRIKYMPSHHGDPEKDFKFVKSQDKYMPPNFMKWEFIDTP